MNSLFSAWAVGIICGLGGSFIARHLERKRCVNLIRQRVAVTYPEGKLPLLAAIQDIING